MTTQSTVRDRTVSGPADGPLAARPVVLKFHELHKSFGGQHVLRGVSAQLRQGEVVLLRGDNGSGKTTLLNILSGNLEPDRGVIHLTANGSQEHFHFPRRWWEELNPFDHFTPERVAWEGVGRTWQDVRLFATASLADNIAAATPGQPGENPLNVLLHPSSVSRIERGNRAKSEGILHSLGLVGRDASSGDMVSLGQSKRVAIARAVQGGAKVLFLDEPLAGLDQQGIEDVMALLASLAQQQGVTLVIVEHLFNIPRILGLAQTVWTLRDGAIQVEPARSFSAQVSNGLDEVIKALLAKFAGAGSQIHEQSLVGGAKLIRIAPPPETPCAQPPILDVRSLAVQRNQRLVIGHRDQGGEFHGLSFTLHKGEVAVLCAPNGWGKTTLLEAISGIIPTSQGQVLLRGVDSSRLPPWRRFGLGLRFVPSRNTLFPNLSIADFQVLSRQPSPQVDHSVRPNRLIGELSGGERQQLTLDDFSTPESLLILDEPFQGLDDQAVTATIERLGDFIESRSGTLLIAQPASLKDNSHSTH